MDPKGWEMGGGQTLRVQLLLGLGSLMWVETWFLRCPKVVSAAESCEDDSEVLEDISTALWATLFMMWRWRKGIGFTFTILYLYHPPIMDHGGCQGHCQHHKLLGIRSSAARQLGADGWDVADVAAPWRSQSRSYDVCQRRRWWRSDAELKHWVPSGNLT